MYIDKTTLYDLSVFNLQDDSSLFYLVDYTTTSEGKSELIKILHHPLNNLVEIQDVQEILKQISERFDRWPDEISNGTLMVIEKFFDDNPDPIPEEISHIQAKVYKWIHPRDYALILFSMKQLFLLIKGYQKIHEYFSQPHLPAPLAEIISETKQILSNKHLQELLNKNGFEELSEKEVLYFGRLFHIDLIQETRKLIKHYGKLDAWHAMAKANNALKLHVPVFTNAATLIEAKSLRHLLLEQPVSYDITMNKDSNFIFLTGANMAGKSTLIKAVGLAVYMAHLGMGVPAEAMKLSLFEGLLSNINIADNISKGESYFFNEVKRIKETIEKINDGRNWLVLIDELFKGTNIQDAMKCSTAVIRGLINIKHCLFILSTHLYEIGEDLKDLPTIDFKYFETILKETELHFSYQLKNGISQDRMGYLILKKEGVISMLENLGNQQI
ncbi:MAG: DNA mismatch repair protein MutS [Chitinophagia bacterium]|nr:DNA mismatch repair protein MutS [Chitinophagia bacterium]